MANGHSAARARGVGHRCTKASQSHNAPRPREYESAHLERVQRVEDGLELRVPLRQLGVEQHHAVPVVLGPLRLAPRGLRSLGLLALLLRLRIRIRIRVQCANNEQAARKSRSERARAV